MCVADVVCLCACVYPEPNSVTETGLDELDLFSTRPHDQLRNNVSKSAIPHVDTRFPKHSLKKHISGSKSRPATPHADARFRKHPPKKHISGSRSKPAITQVDARFCKHQLETSDIITDPSSRKDRAQYWIAQKLDTGWETTYDRGIENEPKPCGTWGWDDFAPAGTT